MKAVLETRFPRPRGADLARSPEFAERSEEVWALVREEARRIEQAQIDLMVDRLGHVLAVKSISASNVTTNGNANEQSAKEQMLAANALLAQLRAQKAVGRVSLPAEGIARLHGGERYDVPLLGGDAILVPRRAGTVTVVGEVLSPGAFSVSAAPPACGVSGGTWNACPALYVLVSCPCTGSSRLPAMT